MRVLIADDHPFIRKGIRETLGESLGILEITEAEDGLSAYELLTTRPFDLAIVDISMPGKDGLELVKEALALRPGLPFIVMSVYSEREFAQRAYRAGARGYLAKSSPPGQFIEAVRRVLGGGTYVSPEYAELLVRREGRGSGDESPEDSLTDRELAVLRLIASGKALTEIGRELNLSVKTVSTYKSRAMEKLGLGTNAELIAYALERGLG